MVAKKPLSAAVSVASSWCPGGAVSRGRHGVGDGDGGIPRQVRDVDVRALAGQPERDRATHARAAPDHRGDSALEPAGHAQLPSAGRGHALGDGREEPDEERVGLQRVRHGYHWRASSGRRLRAFRPLPGELGVRGVQLVLRDLVDRKVPVGAGRRAVEVGLPEPLRRNETVEPVDGLDHVDVAVPAVERLVLAGLGVAEDDHEVGAHVAAPPRPLPGILRESWLTAMATGRTSMTRRFGLSSSRAKAAGSAGCIRDVNFGRNHSRVARSR